jgi:hypothetical protein
VAATASGGFLVGGTTQRAGGTHDDGWLLLVDGDGSLAWERSFGGPLNDGVFQVAALADGGIAAVGYTDAGGSRRFEVWVLRFDGLGNLLWQRTLGLGPFDAATGVVGAVDGGLLVAGVTSSDAFRRDDVWMMRFGRNGELMWDRVFPKPGRDGAWALVALPTDRYVVAAATDSFGAGSTDAWLFCIDDLGKLLWERVYGGAKWDRPTALAVTRLGGLVLVGYTTSSGAGYEDYWVLSLNGNGRL